MRALVRVFPLLVVAAHVAACAANNMAAGDPGAVRYAAAASPAPPAARKAVREAPSQALLARQQAPRCELSKPLEGVPPEQARAATLDDEQQCYRQRADIVHAQLAALQDAAAKTRWIGLGAPDACSSASRRRTASPPSPPQACVARRGPRGDARRRPAMRQAARDERTPEARRAAGCVPQEPRRGAWPCSSGAASALRDVLSADDLVPHAGSYTDSPGARASSIRTIRLTTDRGRVELASLSLVRSANFLIRYSYVSPSTSVEAQWRRSSLLKGRSAWNGRARRGAPCLSTGRRRRSRASVEGLARLDLAHRRVDGLGRRLCLASRRSVQLRPGRDLEAVRFGEVRGPHIAIRLL